MKQELAIIVAASKNNVIGINGTIPWRLQPDLKHFKEVTTGYPVVMGKNTFHSLPFSLPKRLNVVVTSDPEVSLHATGDFITVTSLKEILWLQTPKIFFIGGQRVYEEAMTFCNKIYLTRVLHDIEGDTYFPEIDMKEWKLVKQEGIFEYNEMYYLFEEYERI